ncbi:MAG: chromosome partitioning protein ParB [Planctomycetota bacterium]
MLLSISAQGIRDPLAGVDKDDQRILLDGFKRYRCAVKLNIGIVPYLSLAGDEPAGIIELMRISNAKSLSILEQARLIDELINVHQMGNAQIATLLERSKAWVSVRSGIISQMSSNVMSQIFNGKFPVYSFMYTLRQFMRLNGVKKEEIDEFVNAVAGKHLSTREIDLLANAFFKGSDEFREQIKNGNLSWGLTRLKQSYQPGAECTERERQVLKALEITQKYMRRLILICNDTRLKTNTFYAQANLLSGGILRQLDAFTRAIRQFYDRSRQA